MSSGFTAERDKPPPGNLKERIAALQQKQRSVSPSSPVNTGVSPNAAGGGLRAKIAKFEEKGSVPAPRTAFGLGVPIADQQRTNRELIGNRVPGVNRPVGAPHSLRSPSPLLNAEDTPSPSSRRTSRDYSAKSDDGNADRPERPELETFEKKRRRVSLATSDSLGGHSSAGPSPIRLHAEDSVGDFGDPPSPSPIRQSSLSSPVPKTPEVEQPRSPIVPQSPSIVVSTATDKISVPVPPEEKVADEEPVPTSDTLSDVAPLKPITNSAKVSPTVSPIKSSPPSPVAVADVFFVPQQPTDSSEDDRSEKTPRVIVAPLPVPASTLPLGHDISPQKVSPIRRRTSPLPSPKNPDPPPNIPLPPIPPTPPSTSTISPPTRRAKSNPNLLVPKSPSPYDLDNDDGDYGSVVVHAKGYTEPNLSTPLPSKSTFTAVVHQKVTQPPPLTTSVFPARSRDQTQSRRQTMSHAIVTPSKHESAGYGDLAELLSEAALLEERLSRKDDSTVKEQSPLPPVPARETMPRSATPEAYDDDDERPPPPPPKTFSSGMRSTFRKMTGGGGRLSIFSDTTASSSSTSQETAPTSIEQGYLLVTEEGYTKPLNQGSVSSSQSSVRSKQSVTLGRSKSFADRLFNRSRTKSITSHLDIFSPERNKNKSPKSPTFDQHPPSAMRDNPHLDLNADNRPQSWQSASSTATVSVIDSFPPVPETLPAGMMMIQNGHSPTTKSTRRQSSYSTYEQTYAQAYQNGQLNHLQSFSPSNVASTAGDTYQYQYVGAGGKLPNNASNPQLSQ